MKPLRTIEKELQSLGYRHDAIVRDYSFADVLSDGAELRVELAAFTQVPQSYRSAAFGVISAADDETAAVARRRALGAPILFAIGAADVGVWRVGADGTPRLLERVGLDELPGLFQRNADRWRPLAIHRAKSLGLSNVAYQLDFVDLGLLPAIEREVEIKLDILLRRTLQILLQELDTRFQDAAFRTTFRLLAAKILLDREHPKAQSWRNALVSDVLRGIEAYYALDRFSALGTKRLPLSAINAAWEDLKTAINFRNISADSLAFVYENTLVTKDTRKRFGTHSTPRQVAEYVLTRIDLDSLGLDNLLIYEPFTGAGAFLVASVCRIRDLLPDQLTPRQRHAFLVKRIRGADIDAFACEVAKLSLILADYPNANGWQIETHNLFASTTLESAAAQATVVLCNPPWEDFNAEERNDYAGMAQKSVSRPMAVLQTVLAARPKALGFILPQGFLRQQQYASFRQKVAEIYGRVDLTSLPDRIFQRAGFEGAVLIATERRNRVGSLHTHLTSAVVEDDDRMPFLATGKLSSERRRNKIVTAGDLWITELDEIWEHLRRHPSLASVADVYRGLQWSKQHNGLSPKGQKNSALGVIKPKDSLSQFEIHETVYLNIDPKDAMYPGPLQRPWHRPKVLTNVARLSRGPWRMAAASDTSGLFASQAFFGIWPTQSSITLEVIEALLNSPLTNAFLTEHASNQHFTNDLLKELPIPKSRDLQGISDAVIRYRQARNALGDNATTPELAAYLNRLLLEIDAQVLKAYDLPPRLERRLLEFFRGHESERRISHPFDGWVPADFTAFVPLHEFLGPLIEQNRGPWVLETFTPAPDKEVSALKRFLR